MGRSWFKCDICGGAIDPEEDAWEYDELWGTVHSFCLEEKLREEELDDFVELVEEFEDEDWEELEEVW